MINFRHLTLRRGTRVLLEDINWTIFRGQHIGLTGANGSGKSSLFALMLGELAADGGEVEIPLNLSIAHVAQEMPATTQSAVEFVMDGDVELRRLQQALEQAERENNGLEIAHIHEALNCIDAWSAPSRAACLLDGLGFQTHEMSKCVREFSGGWQMRLLLAQALMCRSDMLFLDEPTNHLDLDAVIWLTTWLKDYPGTLLMISHDRDFLDETVQHIAHIENKTLETCTGNYSDCEEQRAQKRALQGAHYKKQQLQIAKMQQFVDRFRAKASKARQAQSRLKALSRLERIAEVQVDSPFNFHFREPDACPQPLLQLEHATLAYDQNVIFRGLYFSVSPGERVALIGPNGAGKSTLIRALAGELVLADGDKIAGRGLKTGYFAQHHVDHLQQDATPLAHLAEIAPNISEREQRGWLGSFGFSGDRVKEPVRIFSGGEKSRLALALLIFQKPNLLLLDEPANHLDMAMRDALSFALQEFKGAMVLVSHDRFLIRSTVDQLFLVANHEVKAFAGDLQEYEKWLTNYRKQQKLAPPLAAPGAEHKKLPDLRRLEARLEKLQQQLAAHEARLADPVLHEFTARDRLQAECAASEKVRAELREVEEMWFRVSEGG